jgi:hypothetical protein
MRLAKAISPERADTASEIVEKRRLKVLIGS